MKRMVLKLTVPAVALVVLVVLGCSNPSGGSGDGGPPVVHVSAVSLNKATLTLGAASGTETLIATITPADATNKTVTWTSSAANVATVDAGGVVTAEGVGEAIITVTTEDGEYTATCNVTVSSHGISLDQSGTFTFPAAVVGYATAPEAKSVTITNTGNQATGELTAALSGTNESDFTLSGTPISSIAVGADDTFTVVPNTGLAVGTYTATVTLSGDNDITASFTVSFEVIAAVYSITLSQTETYTFPAAVAGYTAPEAKSVTVTNTGNQATGALTVGLSGDNDSDFTLSKTSISDIAVDGNDSFTVVPNTGLAVGTYTATVTLSGDNSITANFTVSFTVNPVPTYGISLSQSGLHTFTTAIVGYGAQTPKAVTVTNTGNQATGELTAALSGTNDSDFTLSTPTINSIVVGADDTFTVVPKTGLVAGTYTATVTLSGDNSITANFEVSFTVNPVPAYGISLDQSGTLTFPEAVAGYGEQAVQTITVTNTGNQETGALTAALSGTNDSDFTLSTLTIDSIAVDGNDTFTVVPKTGLAVGTYTATVTISGGNGISATFTVSFTVQLPAYTMKAVSTGTVNTENTGSGNTANWGAGNNSAYTKPYSMSAFSIGETEITYELWKAVYNWATDSARGANQYTFANPGREGNDGTDGAAPTTARQEPVTYISWRDAIVWCNAYSEAAGKTPVYTYNNEVLRESEDTDVGAGSGKAEQAAVNTAANGFRLPTEAEWEYAARGGVPGTGTPWTDTYAGSNTLDDVAVYQDNSGNKTAVVKSKTGGANSLGLYDMSGNVVEWCQDVYSGTFRVIRGGSWGYGASYCAVARRDLTYPDLRSDGLGFRLAACSP